MTIDTSPISLGGLVPRVELRDVVTATLRELIFTGEFQPGERLVETELAERFGTSRGPVRDAFAELEQVGLLQSGSPRGTYVRTITTVDVDELYTLRQSLEGLAARRATDRLSPAAVEQLRSHQSDLDEAVARADAISASRADMAFHRTLVEHADHERLLDAWERVADQTRLLMRELSTVHRVDESGALDHSTIIDAFHDRDATRAHRAITDHLEIARESMMLSFTIDAGG